MADKLPSDHDAVESRRVAISRVGRTDRPQVELPADLDVAPDDVVVVALDGEAYHGQVETTLDGTPVLRRAGDNPRLARDAAGENRLVEWVRGSGPDVGSSAHLDVVTAGYMYGLRSPGRRVVYDATSEPDPSLADIARDLEE